MSLLKETKFEFWYFMFGSQIGTLELVLNNSNVVWSLSGKQENSWLLAEVQLPAGNYLVGDICVT